LLCGMANTGRLNLNLEKIACSCSICPDFHPSNSINGK